MRIWSWIDQNHKHCLERCLACTGTVQIGKGLGFPNKYFCNAKIADVYTSALLADAMKPLNVLSKFENHFAIRTVRFQVQLEADGYFLQEKFFEFATVASRASRYHLASFEPDFLQIQLQNTCWASPKPDIQHKNALVSHLNDR